MKDSPFNLKEAAADFLRYVVKGKIREAYQDYIGEDFIHHNAYFKGDPKSLMEAMEENHLLLPDKSIEIRQVIQEGDKVMVHSLIRRHAGDTGLSTVHIFRFRDGKVIELWDIGMEIPTTVVNENGAF